MKNITPLILTYNEAPNIQRTLSMLGWAQQIVVVDSGSSDETLDIIASYQQVKVVCRGFDTFAQQCNFGLSQIQTDWVLSLDADYVLTEELVLEIERLEEEAAVSGYRAGFSYCVFGRPLRGTLYPPRTVLYRRDKAHYQNIGHGHRVQIQGDVQDLHSRILHDDRKALGRWCDSQRQYASLEAENLLIEDEHKLNRADRIRKRIWLAAPAVFFYTLFVKGCLLDGWPGWYYAFQRTYAELLLSLELLDRRLRNSDG